MVFDEDDDDVVNWKFEGNRDMGMVIVIGTFCVLDDKNLFVVETVAVLLLLNDVPVVIRGGFKRAPRILFMSC